MSVGRLNPDAGQDPSLVALDLQKLDAIKPKDAFTCLIEDGPALAAGTRLTPPPLTKIVRTIAEDLARLQPHTSERLLMPDISLTTDHQADDLHRLAVIYDEGAIEERWERLVLTISDSSFLTNESLFNGEGVLALTHEPEFTLGSTTYRITRTLAHQYLTPCLVDETGQANTGN